MSSVAKVSGAKGYALEEILKTYFARSNYLAVRGIPYVIDGEDVTDIDLWLYERPGAATRRRLIVDIKNRKSPRTAERIVWTKGLQSAVGVDSAIVASPTKSQNMRRFAKSIGVVLLDGDAIGKLTQSETLREQTHIPLETLNASIRTIDAGRRSVEWKTTFDRARMSLISGFGSQSANFNLGAAGFFAEQAVTAGPRSEAAATALRLLYFTAALVSISLDFVMADHAFRSHEERRQVILDGLRFGQADQAAALAGVKTAIALTRQYADNGNAVAKQIETSFFADAERLPAEVIADHVAKISGKDTAFIVARELEAACFASAVPSFDVLPIDTKAFLGVVLDFNGIAREKIASLTLKASGVQPSPPDKSTTPKEGETGVLFPKRDEKNFA
jgi:hypothetical protein